MSYYIANGSRSNWVKHFQAKNNLSAKQSTYTRPLNLVGGIKRIIDLYESDSEILYYSSVNTVEFLTIWSG